MDLRLKALLIFVCLHVADLGTTVAVLRLGGVEENPLVQFLMAFGSMRGLILAKLITAALGIMCFLTSKHGALRLANVIFGAIIAWNLSVIARLV